MATESNALNGALRLYLATLALLLLLGMSIGSDTRYAWAQRELELLSSMKMASWDAYVDDAVSKQYWLHANPFDRNFDPLWPDETSQPAKDDQQQAYQSRSRFERELGQVFARHQVSIDDARSWLRPGYVFGWRSDEPKLDGPIGQINLTNPGAIWVFKPDLPMFFRTLDAALGAASARGGRLETLRCTPPSVEQIERAHRAFLGSSAYNDIQIYIPVYPDVGGDRHTPLTGVTCDVVITGPHSPELLELHIKPRGRILQLNSPGFDAWFKLQVSSQPLEADIRQQRIIAGYAKGSPFFDASGAFLPFAKAVWSEISGLTVGQAIAYLDAKRHQDRESVEVFGLKFPRPLAIALSPLIILALCINMSWAVRSTSAATIDEWRSHFESGWWSLSCAIILVALPVAVLSYVMWRLSLHLSETDDWMAFSAVIRRAFYEANLPQAWERQAATARNLLLEIFGSVGFALGCGIVSAVVGARTARRLLRLRQANGLK